MEIFSSICDVKYENWSFDNNPRFILSILALKVLLRITGKPNQMQKTTVKTTRETLDRLRPYAQFRDSWDTVLNNVIDIADNIKREDHEV